MREHTAGEQLGGLELRRSGIKEPRGYRTLEHGGDHPVEKSNVPLRTLVRKMRPTQSAVIDLVAQQFAKDSPHFSRPHRMQKGGEHAGALRFGDAAGGHGLVENALSIVEPTRRDFGSVDILGREGRTKCPSEIGAVRRM